jgi:hypothetical protein
VPTKSTQFVGLKKTHTCVTYELLMGGQDTRRLIWKPNLFSLHVNPVHILKTYMYHILLSILIFSSNPRVGLTSMLFFTKGSLAL